MTFEAPFVGERKHFVVHPGRITDAQNRYTAVNQFFGNPVDSHITLCTDEHLTFPMECFVDSLYQRSCFSSSRRSVDNCYVFGAQHQIDGGFLARVQPGKAYGLKSIVAGWLCAVKDFTQFGQSAGFGPKYPVECFEHQFVGCFVQIKLHPEPISGLKGAPAFRTGKGNGHYVAVYIAYLSLDIHIFEPAFSATTDVVARNFFREETNRFSRFKVMVGVELFRTFHFNGKLVERIVVAFAYA